MFKKKTKDSTKVNTGQDYVATGKGSTNSLVAGTNVEGIITADNDIRIDGSLHGTLHCKGRVIIGPDGKVDGEVNCKNAVIEGKFTGKITVEQLLNVRDNAQVEGEVQTSELLVQPGALYNVTCSMSGTTHHHHKFVEQTNGVEVPA